MPNKVRAFYAYPSRPPALAETIKEAIKEVAKSKTINVKPWTQLSIVGKVIIDQITEAITRADLFLCDLTTINNNVIFELGYAIGSYKPIWISLNVGIAGARDNYELIHPTLVEIGYAPYVNSRELASALIRSEPQYHRREHLLGSTLKLAARTPDIPSILYLNSPIHTDASITVSDILQTSYFSQAVTIDDPKDNPAAPLQWYTGKIQDSHAVIAHFLASNHIGAHAHNIKCSFVCGLAVAFGKAVLMLAHEPFDSPMDYKHILKSHATAAACRAIVLQWLDETESTIPIRRQRRPPTPTQRNIDLRHLSIGETTAENELARLDDYFVETNAYYESLSSQKTIFVGRRGTGKTANFYALRTEIGRDRRNHVCAVKPVGYDIDGVIRVLSEGLHSAEHGYLIESLWKYMLYSELTRSIVVDIKARPLYYTPSIEEARLLEFVDQHSEMLLASFAVRLEDVISSLSGVGDLTTPSAQRVRISEKLHEAFIPQLRNLLGLVLAYCPKVAVVIDNLDESWVHGQNVEVFAILMLGLLRVTSDIADDFNKSDRLGRRVNLSIIIFLRSDIVRHIMRYAPEQDKLPIRRISWDDSQMLLRVLEQRMVSAMGGSVLPSDIWDRLFVPNILGMSVSEFVLSSVMSRPRDAIYFLRTAVADAINRGHTLVLEEGLFSARSKYSDFALKSVIAEDDPQRGRLRSVLFSFSRADTVLTRSKVDGRIRRVTGGDDEVSFYFDLLCDLNFLGIETTKGHVFARDEGERESLLEVARNASRVRDQGEETYLINSAFYDVLQIG